MKPLPAEGAPKGAEVEAAWEAASRLAPSGVSGARPRPRRCLSRGTEASARMWRDFREPSLIRDLGRTAWLLTVYADGPHLIMTSYEPRALATPNSRRFYRLCIPKLVNGYLSIVVRTVGQPCTLRAATDS